MKRRIQIIALALMSLLLAVTIAEAGPKGRRRGGLPPKKTLTPIFNKAARGGGNGGGGVGVRNGSPTQPRPRGPYFRPNGGSKGGNSGPKPRI